jgi:uncharacterized membrane protein
MGIEDQIKEVFGKSWKVFANQFVVLILGTLLSLLLMIFIVTIPPLIFGIYILCLNTIKGKGKVSDIFEGFSYFFRSWGLMLLLILGIAGGLILLVVPGILLMIMWQYSFAFAILRKKGVIESMGASYGFAKKNFAFSVIFWILIIIVGSLGSLTKVGILLTMPFSILATIIVIQNLGKGKTKIVRKKRNKK